MKVRITCAGNSIGLQSWIRNACNVYRLILLWLDTVRDGILERLQSSQQNDLVDRLEIGLQAQETGIMELAFSFWFF
jgi:hypothetical protein